MEVGASDLIDIINIPTRISCRSTVLLVSFSRALVKESKRDGMTVIHLVLFGFEPGIEPRVVQDVRFLGKIDFSG
jgi:hypothetical protein